MALPLSWHFKWIDFERATPGRNMILKITGKILKQKCHHQFNIAINVLFLLF